MKKNMSIAKKVIISELENQTHPEKVEDVIFWALEFYAKKGNTWGSIVANSIVENIKQTELEIRTKSN